ncbi:D-glucuronyl C5-epimerase family protein [Actinoplanes sp. NPDC004185]
MPRSRSGSAAAVAAILLVAGVPSAVVLTHRDTGRVTVRLAPAPPLGSAQAMRPRQPGSARAVLPYPFKADAYGIHTAPREEYPYALTRPIALVDDGVHDASGVRMYKIGDRLYDHPVYQARYGIDSLESYVRTDDERYLSRAELQAARLMRRADKTGGAWYLPYPFGFSLHGVASDRRVPPWYSAMAQGQALTLFVRLYEITKDATYRNAADRLFAGFLRPRATSKPWVVWVDSRNHLWLEEFPGRAADRTLNGHLFAIFGLWDYWRLTSDERAKTLYQGALTTVRDYFSRYRNENWISRYCLTHPARLSDKYHFIHIRQLNRLYTLTHDGAFLRLAETLTADYPPPAVTGEVRFAAGTHQGVKFSAGGTVAGRRSLRLTAASRAPADRRERIHGQPGYWYRITAGPLAGYHVRENHALVALLGRSVSYDYHPARPATMMANETYTGFQFAANGSVLSRQKVMPAESTSFGVVASAWWNAREYVLAQTGPLAGHWIPRGQVQISRPSTRPAHPG